MGKDLNRNFSKEDMQIAKKHLKRCSTSLITRKMQIETMRYHFIPIMKTTTKTTEHDKQQQRSGEPGNFMYYYWGYKNGRAAMQNSMVVPQKIKIE
jgi:hypothetical protein